MTITGRIDPRHAATFSGACPKCGERRDEKPCQKCGEARTWQAYLRDCMCRGDASGTVNALLAGFAGAQRGGAA
jgi:hypothetical protein